MLLIFHVYFFNFAQSVERCQSSQAKHLQKTQLKTLITFDEVLTSWNTWYTPYVKRHNLTVAQLISLNKTFPGVHTLQ